MKIVSLPKQQNFQYGYSAYATYRYGFCRTIYNDFIVCSNMKLRLVHHSVKCSNDFWKFQIIFYFFF